MKKTFTITALAVLAVSALAVVIDGSIGRGVADGPGGSKGHFDYHVRKVTNDAGTRILGGGTFAIRSDNAARRVGINFRAERFGKNANSAEFAGPGTRLYWRGTVRHEVRGLVVVNVTDNRNAEHPTNPADRFAIRFDAPGTEFDFTWRGEVSAGDLAVFHREE